MLKFTLAILAILVLATCGDTNNFYYGDDAVSTDSHPAQVESDTVQPSDTLMSDVFVADSIQPSADTFVSTDTTSGEDLEDISVLVTSPCDELTCEQGSLCVELDGEATCQSLTACNVGKDCLGRGLCFGNQIWQASGVCSEGFCEMQELRSCDEECDEFTLYYDETTVVSCSEDHLCSSETDCIDDNPCTNDICMYTPHIGVLACNHAYKGEAAICELDNGVQGKCYDSQCQPQVGHLLFVDDSAQSDSTQDHNSCVASFLVKMDNVEAGLLKNISFLNQVGGEVVYASYPFTLYVDGVATVTKTAIPQQDNGHYVGDLVEYDEINIVVERGQSKSLCLKFDVGGIPSVLFGYYLHFVVSGGWAVGMSTGAAIVGQNDTFGKDVQISHP